MRRRAATMASLCAEKAKGRARSSSSSSCSPGAVSGFRLGLIADVQYADVDDGTDFSGLAHRQYRNAQQVLARAAADWHAQGVQTVVQLGDLIDGKNAASKDKKAAFQRVLEEFEGFSDVHHIIGNHDLYNLTKAELAAVFATTERDPYYSFEPCSGWRGIILDSYELTVIGPDATKEAEAMLSASNPNDWRKPGVDFQTGLEGAMKRFVPYNGAVGDAQLKWLRAQLAEAHDAGQRVLVFVHIPLHPLAQQAAYRYTCLPWNYHAILSVLESTDAEVAAVFSGHDHSGGTTDHHFVWRGQERHIPHYSLRAAVEAEEPTCHATLVLSDAGLCIENAHACVRLLDAHKPSSHHS